MRLTRSILMLMSLAAFHANAAALFIQPADTTATAGAAFSLDVNVEDAVDLYAFQFDLHFTPDLLSATSITEGNFLSDSGSTVFLPGTIDNTAGSILFTANTLTGSGSGISGDGTLAVIHFNAISSGVSPITLSDAVLLNSALVSLTPEQINGSVTVNPVPEPVYFAFVTLLVAAGAWRAHGFKTTPKFFSK